MRQLVYVSIKMLLDSPKLKKSLLFSWHITNEVIANLRRNGFKGKFITPLPKPKILNPISELAETTS